MKPLKNGKNTIPPNNSKRPAPRRSSNPSSASPSTAPSRRSSAPQCRKSSPSPTGASQKPSPPRPGWQRPSGKACNSPTQIPVPVKPASARKITSPMLHDGKRTKAPNFELTPPTPSSRGRRVSSTPKTPSPLLQQLKLLDDQNSPPTSSHLPRRDCTKSNASSSVVSRTSSLTTSMSPLRNLNLTAHQPTRPPTPAPDSSPPRTPTYVTCPEPSLSPSKHDSLSPFFNKEIFNSPSITTPAPFKQSRHLSPSRPLPPSPSTLHPYISKTHISPSCTSGSLTHRLLCGHLIITTKSDTCKKNCRVEVIGFEMARLKAQGFIRNIRDLNVSFICPICVEELLLCVDKSEEERVQVFGKMLGVGDGDDVWIAQRNQLLWLLQSGSTKDVREFIEILGRSCWPVLNAGLLDQHGRNHGRKTLVAQGTSTKSVFQRSTEKVQGLGIRV